MVKAGDVRAVALHPTGGKPGKSARPLDSGTSGIEAPTFGAAQTVNTAVRGDTIVMGDFNGDGIPDVAIEDSQTGNVEVHYGNGTGGYLAATGSFSVGSSTAFSGMAAGDLDTDGTSELVFASGTAVTIYDRQSDGSYAQIRSDGTTPWTPIDLTATGISAVKAAVGNLSGTGTQDIVVSDEFGAVGVVWIPNDGTGNFGTPAAYAASGCSGVRPLLVDVDGDTLPDVVLNDGADNGVTVLLNQGNGTLGTATKYFNSSLGTGFHATDVAVADVDGDGHPDLVQTGWVLDNATFDHDYSLSVNLNNGNGTFADGMAFPFTLNGGVSIGAQEIVAGDFTGNGTQGVATLFVNPQNSSAGFIVVQWSGTGSALTAARQDAFTESTLSYASLITGYTQPDGTAVNFNNDLLPDVVLGSVFFTGSPQHSILTTVANTGASVPVTGRDVNFAKADYDVDEGGAVDVTILRGPQSTGQVLVAFGVGGTAQQDQAGVKTPDYTITAPANHLQEVTFGANDFSESIHIETASLKGLQPDKTIELTLLAAVGDTELGSGTTATVTIHSTNPSTLGKPGALTVKPTNVLKPAPKGTQAVGRTGSDWDFAVSQPLPAGAVNPTVTVQTSIAPPSFNAWTDYLPLTHGKGSQWTGVDRNPPLSTQLYFRTVTSVAGYPDRFGAPTQPFGVIPGPELALNVTGSSSSDSGAFTTHEGETITYTFDIENVSKVGAAGNAVLTVPIVKHTTYVTGFGTGTPVLTKDKTGRVTAVTWNIADIPSNSGALEVLTVQVDDAAGFSTKDPTKGFGYDIVETGYNLSDPSSGIKAAAILRDSVSTEILGTIKMEVNATSGGATPGGTITYLIDAENDGAVPVTGATVLDEIPAGTVLDTLYTFDSNGNAETTPLPNPGAFTNPGIIYAKTDTGAKIDLSDPPLSVAEMAKLGGFLKAKAGDEIDLSQVDQTTVDVLVNDGFIAPDKVKWTLGTLPGVGGGQSNVAEVAMTVRVPYDAPAMVDGSNVVISNGHFNKSSKPVTVPKDSSSYDFILSNGVSALYGNPPREVDVELNNPVAGTGAPHLFLEKVARGSLNLNNPNFHGNGFTSVAFLGNLVTVAAGHGVDYQLIYRNDLDANGNGADAHDVVLHDVIPDGMQLAGFFTQNVMDSGTGPMFAEQFTFYDKSGQIIPAIDPTTNSNNMALVRSMDIRLGAVSAITTVPQGTFGTVEYTCVPTITPQTVLPDTRDNVEVAPGIVHAFGGFQPGQTLTSKYQGFYISTSDQLTPVQGCPDDTLVKVVADVSWNFPAPTHSVNSSQPLDVVPFDFNFTQNGDISAPGSVITFSVPQGVTFLDNANFVPPAGAVVTVSGTEHHVADGNTAYDTRPFFTDDESIVTASQSGSNVTLTLGTVTGHAARSVRAFFQINGPTLDAALAAAGSFHPVNPHVTGSFTPAAKAGFLQALANTGMQTADAAASGTNSQQVHALNPPRLGIARTEPYSVPVGAQYTYKVMVTNMGDTAATNVVVGAQIPWGTTFVSADTGEVDDGSAGGTPVASVNTTPYVVTRQRDSGQVKGTGAGPDILNWHLASLPAQSKYTIKLTVKCGPSFADYPVQDHSAFVSADNVGTVHIAADPVSVWIFKDLNASKIQAAQIFFELQGVTITPGMDAAVATLAQAMDQSSTVHAIGGLDHFDLTKTGVKIIPLGKGQVFVISNDGGSVVSNDGGSVVSNDGGSVVSNDGGSVVSNDGGSLVQGDASLININGGSAVGTHTAEYMLNNIPSIIAAGGGNIIAAGGGNLISQDGSGLISNEPGGGILAPMSALTNASAFGGDNGRNFLNGGGNALATGMPLISQDGSGLISQDGSGLISQDGSGLISQDGSGLVSEGGNGLSVTHTGLTSNAAGSAVPPSGRAGE